MLDRTARPKRNGPGVECTRSGECTGLAPTHAAPVAAPDKPAATGAAAVAFQPRLSPFRARKPHSRAVRLMSPFMQPPLDKACLPPWLNHVKTRGALFDGIVIFFRNRNAVRPGSPPAHTPTRPETNTPLSPQ